MINEIRDAFKENLPLLKWMDSDTRKLAKEKVSTSIKNILKVNEKD